MEDSIEDFIKRWFSECTGLSMDVINGFESRNYFEHGYMDSIQFISLVESLEDHFNIRFQNQEFQNREFATILGLTRIVNSKVNG